MRIVQAGVGRWGIGWAASLRATPPFELVAIADPTPAAREEAVARLGLPAARCFGSLAEALAAVGCEAVLVATPPASHRAVAEAALAAGRHVLVEKPLATDLGDALALVGAARAAGRILMVSQNYRYRRAARMLRSVVAGGALGELTAVSVGFRREVRSFLAADDFRWGMRQPLLLEMGVHHLDLVRMITGREIETVFARSWPIPGGGFAHAPAVSAILTLAGGAVVTYGGALTPYGPQTSWNGDWELVGERGRLRWLAETAEDSRGAVVLEPRDGGPERLALPAPATEDRAAVLDAFRAAVATGAAPETSGADNAKTLAAVLACARSAETGEVVDVARFLETAQHLAPATDVDPAGSGPAG